MSPLKFIVTNHLIESVAIKLCCCPALINLDMDFRGDLNYSDLDIFELGERLERIYKIEIDDEILFNFSSLQSVIDYLVEQLEPVCR